MSVVEALRDDNVEGIRGLVMSDETINAGLVIEGANEILMARPPPLSVAAFYRSVACLRFLLGNGANVSKPDQCRVCSLFIEFQYTLRLLPVI